MASSITDTLSKIRSAMKRSGIFTEVLGIEPDNSAGAGLSAAVFFTSSHPVELVLNGMSSLYVYTMRIFTDQLASPPEAIEELIVSAVDKVFDLLAGDFDVGKTVREVDFMGQFGTPVSSSAGYVPIPGNPDSRIVDIIIPLVVNDTMELG
jgi:hypothetical protein